MIAGILFFGEDTASLGMDEQEIDGLIDERIDLLHEGLNFCISGSVLGTSTESDVNFCLWKQDLTSITMNQWAMVSEVYRETFPTFDGHIVILDMMHHTTNMKRATDALFTMLEDGVNLDDLT